MFTSDLAAHLVDNGVTAAIDFHGHLPDQPDSAVVLTPRGGLSDSFEGAFERPALFVSCRGEQNDPHSAEELASEVDAILVAITQQALGGRFVTNVQRFGGPPSLLDRDNAQRSVLGASYIFEIGTA